ncbi:hypothetical protein QTP88_025703 [Uroleucon formosanum]
MAVAISCSISGENNYIKRKKPVTHCVVTLRSLVFSSSAVGAKLWRASSCHGVGVGYMMIAGRAQGTNENASAARQQNNTVRFDPVF